MPDREGAVTFEVQSAYLEGRSDLAALILTACEEANQNQTMRHVLVKELRAICSAPWQYDTKETA
ncbi:MAG: hypothetical protein ACLGIS_14430 [Actinomycetes bacterium]